MFMQLIIWLLQVVAEEIQAAAALVDSYLHGMLETKQILERSQFANHL
jgi:hypothetical protein